MSTSSAAQRELLPLDVPPIESEAETAFALKEQVIERLAAHRARRGQPASANVTPIAGHAPAKPRSARIAAAVAERYANSPSYRSVLAEQAEAAIREAQAQAEAAVLEAEAAAEVACLSARAVADAQYELLAELEQWSLTPPASPPVPSEPTRVQVSFPPAEPPQPLAAASTPGLTVRLYEEMTPPSTASSRLRSVELPDEEEGIALDEEIAFRQSPVFDEIATSIEIPANLIEFPRQLVAPRRARPRLAEGPLREDANDAPAVSQLRIFEVEATQISPAPPVESVETEWSSILLSAQPSPRPFESAEAPFTPLFAPQTAALSLRLMAAIVDACIIAATLLAFVALSAVVYGKVSAHLAVRHPIQATMSTPIAIQTAAVGVIGTALILTLLYQLLFFTFSGATPGMRYARIGLCTFSDDNPTRSAMRRRILASVLAACPLGIGFLWAWLDEEGLGWHDRISRMYQRSY